VSLVTVYVTERAEHCAEPDPSNISQKEKGVSSRKRLWLAGHKAEVIKEDFRNVDTLCGVSPREPRSRLRSDADIPF
jgi:hypothetical protein